MMSMQMTSNFKVGDKVVFGRPNGEQTLGTIVKVNRAKLKVRQDEVRGAQRLRPEGTVWGVPPSLCRLASGSSATPAAPVAPQAKRPDAEIMRDISRVYGDLSPENLTCDGELRGQAVVRRAAALRAKLQGLFREIGRTVREEETWVR